MYRSFILTIAVELYTFNSEGNLQYYLEWGFEHTNIQGIDDNICNLLTIQ